MDQTKIGGPPSLGTFIAFSKNTYCNRLSHPRYWSPQHDRELRKSTSPPPTGFQEVACAPCRYISPTTSGEVMRTLGSPPFPSTIWAVPGISNRRSDFAIAPSMCVYPPEVKRLCSVEVPQGQPPAQGNLWTGYI